MFGLLSNSNFHGTVGKNINRPLIIRQQLSQVTAWMYADLAAAVLFTNSFLPDRIITNGFAPTNQCKHENDSNRILYLNFQ